MPKINVYNYFILTFTYLLQIRPYNLIYTYIIVLSLKLYSKPNNAILKRLLSHLVSQFQSRAYYQT